jgi:hypothetical protein
MPDLYNNILEERDLYNNILEGQDFSYFQDCNPKNSLIGYEEHYFNPDHVIIYPDNEEFFWFDLDYSRVGFANKVNRMHFYGDGNFKRKFAFSSIDNKMGHLDYSLAYSSINKQTELETQTSSGHKYYLLDKYVKLCNVTSDGEIEYEGKDTLDDIWNKGKKIKIKIKLGHFFILYPIRLSFLHGKIFSFSSKNVIIPNVNSLTFSWENSHFGNIVCSTNGLYSTQNQIRPKNTLQSLFPSIFPNTSDKISAILNPNINPNLIGIKKYKPLFRKLFGGFIKKYLINYEVIHGQTSFEILYKKD